MWPFAKKQEKDARANYEFTKQDRDFSSELRKKSQELKMKEQQLEHEIRMKELQMQLQDLDYELNGEEETETGSNPDMMLMSLFSQILNKQPVQANSINTPEVKKPEQVVLSDEQLMEMWNNVPKQYRAMAKVMPDAKLIEFLQKNIGNIDTDTTHRALAIIRG